MSNTEIVKYSGSLKLTDKQIALANALTKVHPQLVQMYFGVISILNSDNPDKHALASHNLRELMEKMSVYYNVEFKEQKISLNDKVKGLQKDWEKVIIKSEYCKNNFDGKIDSNILKFLPKAKDFFIWFKSHIPNRNDEIRGLINKLDISSSHLPICLEDEIVKQWNDIRDYFIKTAHHRNDNLDEYNIH